MARVADPYRGVPVALRLGSPLRLGVDPHLGAGNRNHLAQGRLNATGDVQDRPALELGVFRRHEERPIDVAGADEVTRRVRRDERRESTF